MPTVSDSGKADYFGPDPHPFFKRVIDRLPAGRLLLTGEVEGHYATYATEAGWKVHTVVFDEEDRQRTEAQIREAGANISTSMYRAGEALCSGEEFDAVVMMFVHLPQEVRRSFHQQVIECLKPVGGNLFLLAYSQKQPEGTLAQLPDIRLTKTELMEDFGQLQIDLLQEEVDKIPHSDQEVNLLHLTAVRNQAPQSRDSVTIPLKG
jgi:cyclopropane fatty-acyl-phospholipid synthase-like methyltransferase